MNKKGILIKKIIGLSSLGLFTLLASQAYAAGYKLEFQSPSVLADAGEAAVVEDAGTNWYNSAGLVYLPKQLVAAGTQMYQVSNFKGTATAPSPVGGTTFTSTAPGTSYIIPYIPALHFSLPFKNPRLAFGMSIVPAWGLSEDWKENGPLRYSLTRIYTRTLDFAPSLAYKFNDHWSLGVGPDFNYFALQNRNDVRTQTTAGGADSISRVSGQNWSYGYHAGVLYRVDDATRVGLNYRSKININVNGYSSFGLNGFGSFETNQFTYRSIFPAVTTLSMYRDVTSRWALMGTVAYDQWSVVKYNRANNYQSVPTGGNPTGKINVILPEAYDNTLDYSLGTHYKWSDTLMLRGSLKYLNTPTHTTTRGIEFPDGVKLGINIGARLQMAKNLAVDMMYGHVFVGKARINSTNSVTGANVNGNVETSIDVAGAQFVMDL